jgi:hypothetical protein
MHLVYNHVFYLLHMNTKMMCVLIPIIRMKNTSNTPFASPASNIHSTSIPSLLVEHILELSNSFRTTHSTGAVP